MHDQQKKVFGTAIILAGGKSDRMGFDKQQIRIGGISLVEYIANQLSELFDEIFIITNQPQRYDIQGIEVLEDIYKDKGPMGGIYTGLVHSTSDYSYVIAADMPIINTDFITYMKKAIYAYNYRRQHEAFACTGVFNGFMEPFNAFYHKEAAIIMKGCIHKDHLKLTRLINDYHHIRLTDPIISIFDGGLTMYSNLNTPAKLRHFQDMTGNNITIG